MATITANVTLAQLRVNLQDIAARLASGDLTRVMKVGAISAVSEIKQRFATSTGPDGQAWQPLKFPRARTGGNDKPLRDTGQLMGSMAWAVTPYTLTVGTVKPQANLQHYGGVVVPVKGKFLAIPLTKAAIYAGSPTRFAGPHRRGFRGNLRPIINKAKTGGVLVDANGVAQYALTKKVTVPPRPFMGFSEQWREYFIDILTTYLLTGRL